MAAEKRRIVVDTSGLFVSASRLRALVDMGAALSVPDLVVFEFLKSVRQEASEARGSGNKRREEVMAALERRLPAILRALEIDVWAPELTLDALDEVYTLLAQGHEPGDALIWVKMKKEGLDTIATSDVSDWKAMGASVVSLA